MGIFVPIPPHQAELQEVVGEEEAEDANSFSSPSPSVTTKSLAGTTPESSSLQVQHTQLISAPLKDLTKLIMQSVTGNGFDPSRPAYADLFRNDLPLTSINF